MVNAAGPADALGLTGQTVDQIRFDACVDSGGFGLIYRGQHLGLGETVAIKCMRIVGITKADDDVRESIAARFRDETKLLYRLSQGNLDIVRCISSGAVVAPKTRELTPYMVLEWLDGCTLGAEMKERRAQRLPPRSLEATVHLLDSAAGGIAYAHSLDVVHRDIKPGNLFITRTRDGGVRMKVLDFGLAKILSDETIGMRPSVETGVGVHFCSPSYGAPEQFTANMGKIGPWTDVYSLALVLLECMKGEKIRPASTLAEGLLKAIDPKQASPKPSALGLSVSPAVEELFGRALHINPLERPRDVGVFWAELKSAIASSKIPIPAATVMDANIGDAMNEVRAAAARASQRPAPLVGTLMMENAPPGAPHMTPSGGTPRPAAGMPANKQLAMTMPLGAASPLLQQKYGQQPSQQPPPQHPSQQQPQPQPHASQQPSHQQQHGPPGPSVAPMPMSAQSPLASSMLTGSGPPPPMQPGAMPPSAMPPAMPPHGMPQGIPTTTDRMPSPMAQNQHLPDRGPPPRTDPRANLSMGSQSQGSQSQGSQAQIPMKSSKGLVIALVLMALVATGGFGLWWFRMRGH